MFNIQDYNSFIFAIVFFQLIPGAGTFAILNATARNGIGSGMKAVLGTLLGGFICMLATVLGLSTVLSAYPNVLAAVQWIGVTYLCWIGFKLFRTAVNTEKADIKPGHGRWRYFWQALAVSLTNPNVIIFYISLFPSFLSRASSQMTLFVMMIHVTTISSICQTCLVFVGHTASGRLSRWQPFRHMVNRLAGISLIGFGVKLAFNNR